MGWGEVGRVKGETRICVVVGYVMTDQNRVGVSWTSFVALKVKRKRGMKSMESFSDHNQIIIGREQCLCTKTSISFTLNIN